MAGGKKKKQRNLLLLLLLLVAAAGAYALILLMPGTKEEEAQTGNTEQVTLVDMDAAEVVRLEYVGQNSSMVLVKEEDTWYREDDKAFPVNQDYVSSMTSLVGGLRATATVNEAPENLGDYGLEEPAVWVKVTDSAGKTADVKAGLKSPSGDGCYVRAGESDVVYLASSSLLTQFQYTENQMIAKLSTPTIAKENITRILIEKPEGNVELSLEPDNEMDTTGYNPWLVRQGFDEVLPGNSDTIGVLVENYSSFSLGDCLEYSSKDLTPYGLADPGAVLTLTYFETEDTGEKDEDTGEAVTENKYYSFGLKVGDADDAGNYYVQLDGTDAVYRMDGATVDRMINVKPYDYVSRLPGLVNIAQVDKVTIQYGGELKIMSLTRTMEKSEDSEGEAAEEEVTSYFLGDKEVKKEEFTPTYQKMIGVAIDGLAEAEVVAKNPSEPLLTLTFDRTGAGLAPVVTEFFSYDENFGRISVDGISFFRVNIRDVESLIRTFDELFE